MSAIDVILPIADLLDSTHSQSLRWSAGPDRPQGSPRLTGPSSSPEGLERPQSEFQTHSPNSCRTAFHPIADVEPSCADDRQRMTENGWEAVVQRTRAMPRSRAMERASSSIFLITLRSRSSAAAGYKV